MSHIKKTLYNNSKFKMLLICKQYKLKNMGFLTKYIFLFNRLIYSMIIDNQ